MDMPANFFGSDGGGLGFGIFLDLVFDAIHLFKPSTSFKLIIFLLEESNGTTCGINSDAILQNRIGSSLKGTKDRGTD